MTIIELIKKWNINNAWLASELGITRGAFNNKIKGNSPYFYFKESELNKLKSVFKELAKDIKEVK